MPSVNMLGIWECPVCDFDRPLDDGKDAEKIIGHLEGHLTDRESVVVVQHYRTRMLVGVFEDYEAFDSWLDREHNDWDKADLNSYEAKVRT